MEFIKDKKKGVWVGIREIVEVVDEEVPPLVQDQCPSNSCDTTCDMSDMESEVEYVET